MMGFEHGTKGHVSHVGARLCGRGDCVVLFFIIPVRSCK